jgi:aspartate aminotransferase
LTRSAKLINNLPESKTVAISDKARALQQQGKSVINLGGGDPDFPTPMHIVKAAEEAMESGFTHYVGSAGIPELRKAIADKLQKENNLSYEPGQIIVTGSGKVALYVALASIIDPGDAVLVLNPSWVSYQPLIEMRSGRPIGVDLDLADNFRVTRAALDKAYVPGVKAMIVNSPNNPTGRVLDSDEIEAIRSFCVEHDLLIISDEVYERLVYGDTRYVSLGSLPDLKDRTITVNSFSKGYAMTGWRLGYAALPKDIFPAALKVQQHLVTCAASFSERAGVAALMGPQDVVREMAATYEKRMKMVSDGLNRIPGVNCPMPDGAFYLFPEIHYKGMNSLQLADYLLEEAGVAVTPGEAFGPTLVHNVRLSCATSTEALAEAVKRMEKALTR